MVDIKNTYTAEIEALFYAYQAFTSASDQHLGTLGLGRSHHRILYFVGRTPNLSVGELLQKLQISKQALSAPLRQLQSQALVVGTVSPEDRRVKLLRLSAEGERLLDTLLGLQTDLLERTFVQFSAEDRRLWLALTQTMAGHGPKMDNS